MRQSLWSIAIGALGLGSLTMVGGTVIGGELGPMVAGYGVLVVVAALYMVLGIAIRERVWRRLARPLAQRPTADRLAGRRIF
jgi:hypothetical protein